MGVLFRFNETSDDLVFRENLSGFWGFGLVLGFFGLFFLCLLIKQVLIWLSCFLFLCLLGFWVFLYHSSTEPNNPATSQTTRDWNKQTTALLPHSLHPSRGPIQRSPEQEEGLVVCAFWWAMDCSTNGTSSWQGTHSPCSGLVLKAKFKCWKDSELSTLNLL